MLRFIAIVFQFPTHPGRMSLGPRVCTAFRRDLRKKIMEKFGEANLFSLQIKTLIVIEQAIFLRNYGTDQ